MKVLFINYEYPPLGGGAGNATAHLAREMARAGAEVMVITSAFKGQPRRERADGFDIWRIPTLRAAAEKSNPLEMAVFLLSASVCAPLAARRFKPDCVVAFFGIPGGPPAMAVKLACGAPYVVSLRGGDVPGFQPYDLARFHKLTGWLIRLVWRGAGAVAANSQGLAELARKASPGQEVLVIPNGADTALFHPRQGPRREGPVRLLFSGRLVHQKGVDILLEAAAGLDASPAWQLCLAGDGPARQALEALAARLGIADRVRFVGWQTREQLAALARDMDAFVFASRDEGMPNAVLEAMASGLAVVATRIAGNEELVAEGVTGLLTAPESAADLTRALASLMASPQTLAAMGRAGRARVEAHYSWAVAAKNYLALCQRLV